MASAIYFFPSARRSIFARGVICHAGCKLSIFVYYEVNVLDSERASGHVLVSVDGDSACVGLAVTVDSELNVLSLLNSYVLCVVGEKYDRFAVLNSCYCFCKSDVIGITDSCSASDYLPCIAILDRDVYLPSPR